jgi:hypothetical protein
MGQNAAQCPSAISDKVLRETQKIHDQDACYDTERLRENCFLKAQVFRWHKKFRERREDVEDEQRIGYPSTSHTLDNVAKVKAVLEC